MPLITRDEVLMQDQYLYEKHEQLMRDLLIEALEPLVGREIEITRKLKDPADRKKKDVQVLATVVGGHWDWDQNLVLEIKYDHPLNRKLVKTTLDTRTWA